MKDMLFEITGFDVKEHYADIKVKISGIQDVRNPHITVKFDNGIESRRIRLSIESAQNGVIIGKGKIDLYYVFYRHKDLSHIDVSFYLSNGSDTNTLLNEKPYSINTDVKPKGQAFFKVGSKEKAKILISVILNILNLPFKALKVKGNRVTFLSNRTDSPTGNLKAVRDRVTRDSSLEVCTFCSAGTFAGLKGILKFLYLYNTSAVVFVDDYYHMVSFVKKKDSVCLIQLWHACGAFKTFGFSRLGTDSHLEQSSSNHRQYDYAVVSSDEVAHCYAEGFGISEERILPLGSPRCDVLTKDKYKTDYVNEFYNKYPQLQGKKLILFAPTFRGGGNGDAYYPFDKFNVDDFLNSVGDEYALIIKMHPYVSDRPDVSKANQGRCIDASKEDVNNLLFVSHALITDYSSVIYESALVEVPIIFYAFDLDEYIKSRDFYIDYQSFVPGDIVKTQPELENLIKKDKFEVKRLQDFCQRYFGDTMGKATDNVYDLIKSKTAGV